MSIWPEAVHRYFLAHHGVPDDVMPLSSLSHNRIWKVCFGRTCVILKQSAQEKECRFYREAAPELAAQGVTIPALYWAEPVEGAYWYALEYIPKPFPRERWHADADQLRVLHALHYSRVQLDEKADWLFKPAWTGSMTEAVFTFFEAETTERIRPLLMRLEARSQPLFEPECLISGDPNPMNWGLREDGQVVLFDWERFGRGSPALDLAISAPGLPTPDEVERVARTYLTYEDKVEPDAVRRLSHQIALAKTWNVVEFMSMAQQGHVGDTSIIPALVERLPAWFEMIDHYITHETSTAF